MIGVIVMKPKDFSLRIDEELLKKLHYIADYSDRSVNRELLRVIRGHVEAFEMEHGKIVVEKGRDQ